MYFYCSSLVSEFSLEISFKVIGLSPFFMGFDLNLYRNSPWLFFFENHFYVIKPRSFFTTIDLSLLS